MRPHAVRARTTTCLNSITEKRLLNYAVAGAAGMGLLILPQTSEAKIVYTPVHSTIPPNSSLKVDLNGDGMTDFTLTEFGFAGGIVNTGSTHSSGFFNVAGAQAANQVVGAPHQPVGYASALAGRVTVGASGHFLSSKSQLMEGCLIMQGTAVVNDGKWISAKNKYLGLKFTINGETHFGWARLSVRKSGCAISAVLTGYAYETVPNKSIVTGKTMGPDLASARPATLGQLALGAPTFVVWRKEEERASPR